MNVDFEELDYRETALGPLSLRRRTHVPMGVEVYEVKLGDDFLMSSLFTAGETALAQIGLAALGAGPIDVVVGGLGLGYTARAVLDNPAVRSLRVVEALPAVIDWHRTGLVPLGVELTADARCEFVLGDFFALVRAGGIGLGEPNHRFHAILVDIDHSPQAVLNASHGCFYTRSGLRTLATHLQPCGVFALWSNDPPDEEFRLQMAEAFTECEVHVVRFHNPLQRRDAANTIYVGRKKRTRLIT